MANIDRARLPPLCGLALGLSLLSAPSQAQENPPAADLSELPLENLLNLEIYSASKFSQKKSDAPAAVTVITAQDIRDYGYRTLASILESVRGVYTSYDRTYNYAGVRGFSVPGDLNTRVLVLLDGYRLNDNVYDQAPLGTEFPVDVDLIERVEFVPGSGSAIYGNNAFFGVINVITKTGKDLKGHGLEASGRFASYNTDQERITLGRHFDSGADLLLSATHFDSGGPALYFPAFDTPETNFGRTRHTDRDHAARLFGKLSWRQFTFEAGYSSRDKGIPTAPFDTVFNNPGTHFVDQQTFFDLRYLDQIAEHLELAGHVFHGRYDFDGHYVYDTPAPLTQNLEQAHGYWWGSELKFVSTHFDSHKIVFGGEYQDNYHQQAEAADILPPGPQSGFHKSSYRYGIYLQDEFSLRDDLILNAGLRYDDFSNVGDTLNPRVALIYKPWDNTAFKLLYGSAFRAPNMNELYYQDTIYKANPALRPETIKSYEAIIEYQPTPGIRLTATSFHYQIDDFIRQLTDPIDGLQVFQNSGTNKAWGAEAELEQRFDNGIRLRTSYAWVNAVSDFNGKILDNSPVSLAKLNLSLPIYKEWFRLGLDGQYTSSRKTLQGGNTPGFPLLNLTLTSGEKLFQGMASGLEISGSVYNLFAEDYASVAGEEYRMRTIPQNGRNYRMVFTYRY
ncbi:MAG: TonB-dependent receptor plug domain-containing protein [Candidatus Methylumidiphilus sp.]